MAATITGAVTFDKDTYTSGETITATLVRSGSAVQPETDTLTGNLQAPDGTTQAISGSFTVDREVTVAVGVESVSDDKGRTWTQTSDDGHTAVYTATA